MRKNVFLACFSACFRVILLGFPKSRACFPCVQILKSTKRRAFLSGFHPTRENSIGALPESRRDRNPRNMQRKLYFPTGVVLIYKLCYYAICKNLRRGLSLFFSRQTLSPRTGSMFFRLPRICWQTKNRSKEECRRCLWKGLPGRTYRCWTARST